MSKTKMNIKYKTKKRIRKKRVELNKKDELKSNIITASIVIFVLSLLYLGAIGLEKLGLFEVGYTKPEVSTEINYNNIIIGEVFNRHEKEYLVLFDNIKEDSYIDYLVSNYSDLNIYRVDMSLGQNAKYLSEKSNSKANNVSELQINDVTLAKISNGKISKYIVGVDAISEYLK